MRENFDRVLFENDSDLQQPLNVSQAPQKEFIELFKKASGSKCNEEKKRTWDLVKPEIKTTLDIIATSSEE